MKTFGSLRHKYVNGFLKYTFFYISRTLSLKKNPLDFADI